MVNLIATENLCLITIDSELEAPRWVSTCGIWIEIHERESTFEATIWHKPCLERGSRVVMSRSHDSKFLIARITKQKIH